MSEARSAETNCPEERDDGRFAASSPVGMSPYATGGGGVTFERKVAVQYLAHLLAGDSVSELGDDRRVVEVAFQQAPDHTVDDLVVSAARPDELEPSLVLALAIRRSPSFVASDESTQALVRQFVRAVINTPEDGSEHRLGIVVAGPQPHAEQLAKLASLAMGQMDAPGFFDLVRKPHKFDVAIRRRLDHLERLVERALVDLGVAEAKNSMAQQCTWQILQVLTVSMPRLETPDETDWSCVVNILIPIVRSSDLTGAYQLRDRLGTLASEYSPKSARVDLKVLRRDAHTKLDTTRRRHQKGWRTLDHLHREALTSVRDEITASDGGRRVQLDRSASAAKLVATATDAEGVVVTGESGVGKSALALLSVNAAAVSDPDTLQVLCINLRQVHKMTVEFEQVLNCPLSVLLSELSAPQRMLIVDGADAVAEGWHEVFRYLVNSAHESEVKVIAVTSIESKQVVCETLSKRFAKGVADHVVPPLADSEIDHVVETFPELGRLIANPRSRVLLRRLVVIDLLVRGRVSGNLLTDADAMSNIWQGLVRKKEQSDRGTPDARELALLQLANLELEGSDRLDVNSNIDPAALDGLRRDGLLRTSSDNPFKIGPEFTHDELRRYAVARLLLKNKTPALRLMAAGAPRWSLSAARLACQKLLAEADTAYTPLRGRFSALQKSFDALVEDGQGARWGDVPGEALLTLANPDALLRDAWTELLADEAVGLRRVARLVDQRLRDDKGIVDINVVEPIVRLLLEDNAPWRSGEYAQNLLRDWLRGHICKNTSAGHPLRILLRERLAEACAEADRQIAKYREAVTAVRISQHGEQERHSVKSHREHFSEIRSLGRQRRQRPEVPYEITKEIVLELLGLLGPDLGSDGEAILRRVAKDAPSRLAPAVEEIFTGRALASYHSGLLAHLTEAYYLDDEADGSGFNDDGIRSHRAGIFGGVAGSAWYRGPFMPLLHTDFCNGVVVLNRLLNHAARIRVRTLARLNAQATPLENDALGLYKNELEITGARQLYVGDGHVWLWYRGTGVGPDPCSSALQALERVCDQLIENGVPIRSLVLILLHGCESLAMVSLVVGLLVRHLEAAGDLLDPYITEPLIWHHEFERVVSEAAGYAASSEGVVALERRTWTLRDAAMFMVVRANDERAAALRKVGERLIAKARRDMESTREKELGGVTTANRESIEQQLVPVRAWASSLDRDRYQAHETREGLYVQATPPGDVVRALQTRNEDLELGQEMIRLVARYQKERKKNCQKVIGPDELSSDVAIARKLLENPPSLGAYDPWDLAALVATAVIEAHLLYGADLPEEVLTFSADTVLRIGDGEVWPREHEIPETYFEQGADRSAARALPLLLLPVAAPLRSVIDKADGTPTYDRAVSAGINFARATVNEVRLQLARGLDHVWKTPCVKEEPCYHEVGLQLAIETMRNCVLGVREPDSGRRNVLTLEEPITESLASTAADAILTIRLDAAIRALAPAVMAKVCVSTRARDLLLTLLAAQRRSLLYCEHDLDPRDSHTLLSARALLTLAEQGNDRAIYEHIDAYADNSALLHKLLRALSTAAEEAPDRAATARRIWPDVVRHVLKLNNSGHAPFQDHFYGALALAALVPNSAPDFSYLYRELQGNPITWWEPLVLKSEVELWLAAAQGKAECVEQLISFLGVLPSEDQVCAGLPWVAKLVMADPGCIAGRAFMLTTWLIEMRTVAVDTGLIEIWQKVVDALVVAGVTRLASYSE